MGATLIFGLTPRAMKKRLATCFPVGFASMQVLLSKLQLRESVHGFKQYKQCIGLNMHTSSSLSKMKYCEGTNAPTRKEHSALKC
eukprot:scaffold329927_cov40-Tisochrysis_lutea.AAC.1